VQHPPFPPPLTGKTGWPWDFKPEKVSAGFDLPRVTIVTPSYNQAEYLEETIRSVLLQGYPNLEYFVIDGGSIDGSVKIIKKYEPWLAGWVSEKDNGQSNAINKGFSRATGEWLGWLNSDDCLAPYALYNLIRTTQSGQSDFVFGSCVQFGVSRPYPRLKMPGPSVFNYEVLRLIDLLEQPATLWNHRLFRKHGPLAEDLHYAFDWDFFIKCALSAKGARCASVIAAYRLHSINKSISGDLKRSKELIGISLRYLPNDIRKRFVFLLPLLWFLIYVQSFQKSPHAVLRKISSLLRPSLGNCKFLRLFKLPLELWATHGLADCIGENLITIQSANRTAATVSDALGCFGGETVLPANSRRNL